MAYLLPAKPHCLTTRGDSKLLTSARLNRLCVFDDPVSQLRRTVLLDFERQGVIGEKGETLEIAMLLDIAICIADAAREQSSKERIGFLGQKTLRVSDGHTDTP
jgi:hypothetical protein